MSKRQFHLPSPALMISMLALALVLGGTAVAATSGTHADAKADTKLIKKLAPSLKVKSAGVANALARISYVKGPVFDVPANGGADFTEGGGSSALAVCPAGTVVIGTGVHTEEAGLEINEVQPESVSPGAPPTQVRAYVDNFTDNDATTNWVIAVCAPAHAVSNPANLAKRR